MRTLAIGDIHGCLTALDRLLAEVRPQADDLVITLGDYVDRGPDSRGVIDRLLQLDKACTLIPLRGNHEIMMMEARHSQEAAQYWLRMGGKPTIASYSALSGGGSLGDVPAQHWEFLEQTCLDWHETDTHIFVHANAFPDRPLPDQPQAVLHWETMIAPRPHMSGKILVCGHTSQKGGKPRNWGHTVCIDTWVYGEGWLTCLDVDTGELWQANQRDEAQRSMLGLPHW